MLPIWDNNGSLVVCNKFKAKAPLAEAMNRIYTWLCFINPGKSCTHV